MKNYYDILGIDKNASDSDIKKAYRQLSKKWHPDRFASKSDAEKKEAEEKFRDIAEAYDTLGDKDKRAEYDDPNKGFFSSFFTSNRQNQYRPTDGPGDDLIATLDLSIKDLYNYDKPKLVKYKKTVRCSYCGGQRGTSKESCPHCHGTGMITERRQQGFMYFESNRPCPHCHGTGYTVKNQCKTCGGTGKEIKDSTLDVSKIIPNEYFIHDGESIGINGAGGESRDPNMPNGTLNLRINHTYNKKEFRIDQGMNIFQNILVPYYDMILGAKGKQIKCADGDSHSIDIPSMCKANQLIQVKGLHGASAYSKYYVCVNPKFPDFVSPEEEELLVKIQEYNQKNK